MKILPPYTITAKGLELSQDIAIIHEELFISGKRVSAGHILKKHKIKDNDKWASDDKSKCGVFIASIFQIQ